MPLSSHQLHYWIENFYGYGSWDAPVWFIGYEEGANGSLDEIKDKFRYYSRNVKQGKLCDIRALHAAVRKFPRGGTLHDDYFGRQGKKKQGTWAGLIEFKLGWSASKKIDILKYQKHYLAAQKMGAASEALIELFPLPSPNTGVWHYSWLYAIDDHLRRLLKDRKTYETRMFRKRMKFIKDKMTEKSPQVVVFYGVKNRVREIKKKLKPERVKRLKTGQRCYLFNEKTKVLILGKAPSAKKKDIDWMKMGKQVRSLTFP
jgi:hypothetical protein